MLALITVVYVAAFVLGSDFDLFTASHAGGSDYRRRVACLMRVIDHAPKARRRLAPHRTAGRRSQAPWERARPVHQIPRLRVLFNFDRGNGEGRRAGRPPLPGKTARRKGLETARIARPKVVGLEGLTPHSKGVLSIACSGRGAAATLDGRSSNRCGTVWASAR